jgi:protoheme ferro-lyase
MYSGSLDTVEVAHRFGVTLTQEQIDTLERTRVDSPVAMPQYSWYCFDIPFAIVCNDDDLCKQLSNALNMTACDTMHIMYRR